MFWKKLFGKKFATKFPGVAAAQILAINKHPKADRLQLVTVSSGKETTTVVCGAFNIRVGDKVPLAVVGAVLPTGTAMKEVTIRGVKSQGMLCAADELGLGDDHSGIMILSASAKVGGEIDKYLK